MKFNNEAQKVIDIAREEAEKYSNTNIVGTEHILIGLLENENCLASKVLRNNGISTEIVRKMISDNINMGSGVIVEDPNGFSPAASRILENADIEAKHLKEEKIASEHILIAILKDDRACLAIKILNTIKGVNLRKMYMEILEVIGVSEQIPSINVNKNNNQYTPQSNTPILDNYSRDLTKLAREDLIDPVIGREKEIDRMIQILLRRTKNNPCLIGDPGVGKTAVVEGLAIMINNNSVPQIMRNKRLISLDITAIVAGTKYRGEFEERIKRIIEELINNKNIILFIDEIHTIIGAGGSEGALDIANIIKPALARGDIQIIGATTTSEYRKHIEKDVALERRFQTVTIEEPSEENCIKILNGLKYKYEDFHQVEIPESCVEAAVKLSMRYIPDRKLPDKAIDLIDEACSHLKLKVADNNVNQNYNNIIDNKKEQLLIEGDIEGAKKLSEKNIETKPSIDKNNKLTISVGDICDIVSGWTGIPVNKITEDENNKLLNLSENLASKIIGQDEAVKEIAKSIKRNRVGLKDPNKPIGVFLFLGPTGVGKTELTKVLADIMFGSRDNVIRFDMSEYMEQYTVSKLIGSPPGYVGYEEGGQLTEKIRKKPYSIVLFDEIEKAHHDVFNVLLQIMDDGILTDSQGRKVSFKNSIIIMTSNVGANSIIEPKNIGFDILDKDANNDYIIMQDKVMAEVKKTFKPEFINRIDNIIVFNKLSRNDIKKILDLQLNDLTKLAKENLQITLVISDKAKDFILDKGFDEQYGARKLKRTLVDLVENLVVDEKLKGNINSNDNILIDLSDDKLVVEKQ